MAYCYAICRNEQSKPIGYVWLSADVSNDFGYALKQEFWGKGFAVEACAAVVERIKQAGYAYLTATHDVNNPRSEAVMRELGMTYRYSYEEQCSRKISLLPFGCISSILMATRKAPI